MYTMMVLHQNIHISAGGPLHPYILLGCSYKIFAGRVQRYSVQYKGVQPDPGHHHRVHRVMALSAF
jgi:hypothetical protein